jgi:hypothetical protein
MQPSLRRFPGKASNWVVVFLGALAVSCGGGSRGPDASDAGGGTSEASPGALDARLDLDADTANAGIDARDVAADATESAADGDRISLDATADEPALDAPGDQTVGDSSADGPMEAPPPDAGGACGNVACVGSNWAQWPMPNTAADVAGGAPHPAMLIDNGDDTVTDKVTGLMWQRTVSVTTYDRAQAQGRCERLRAGAHADWRVPSAIELASILDYDKFESSVDPKVFPDSPLDDRYQGPPRGSFGTTSVAGTPLAGWLVDFSFGEVQLDTTERDRPTFVRCVRGPRAPDSDTSTGRYDLSMAGTALDIKTGLTWQRVAPNTRRKLAEAKAYCATGTGLPGTGWRVPTIKELMTIVDFAKPTKFRLDQTTFNTPSEISDPYGVFWSATSLVGKPPYLPFMSGTWVVYFASGNSWFVDSTGYSFVRCVR